MTQLSMARLAPVFALAVSLAACGSPGAQPGNEPANAVSEPAATGHGEAEATNEAEPATPAGGNAAQSAPVGDSDASEDVSACLMQDGKRIAQNALHAVGTEPFWAVDVKGRCVTYSNPENQSGVRVWTEFSGTVQNGRWTGALNNQQFLMTTRPKAGCSDGMSDKRYPIAITLRVRGEERHGCAEPR